MTKTFLLTLFTLLLPPMMAHAEITWSGSSGWRYVIRENNDGLSARDTAGKDTSKQIRKDHQLRADLNAAEKGESWDWGVGLRTYSGSAYSEWLNVNGNLDLAIRLENAYGRYHSDVLGGAGAVTIGRAKTVILNDTIAQVLFDKDNRWDGLGWSWSRDNFGLNLSQYVLGARSSGTFGDSTFTRTDATESTASTQSGFAMLYSVQPHITFKLNDEIQGLVALGYHWWQGGAFTNAIHGGTAAPVTATNITGATDNRNPVIMDNARQWHVFTDWSLPMKLRFLGEYVQNKRVDYGTRVSGTETGRKAQNGALALSLAYGKPKKAHEWGLSYSYVRKGIASVVNAFSNGNMPADNIGHLVDAKFMAADGFSLGAKVELFREKAKLAGDGLVVASPYQNRRQTQNRYEFIAGVAF